MTHMAFGDTKIKCAVSRGLGEGRRRICLDNETSRVGHPGTVRWFRRLGAVIARAGPCRNCDGKSGTGAVFSLFSDSIVPQIFTCRYTSSVRSTRPNVAVNLMFKVF
jgi:hypothetical protein